MAFFANNLGVMLVKILGYDLGQEINPIMYTTKEWESYRITPFYENVTRDGIVLV